MAAAAGKALEVSGSEMSLSEAIASGSVPAPELLGFNDWQVWRRTSGTRPSKKKGDEQGRTTKEEADLWRATMLDLYGPSWAAELAEKEALEEESGSDREPLPVGALGGGAGEPSQAEAAGSSEVTPAALTGIVQGTGRGLLNPVVAAQGGDPRSTAAQLLDQLNVEYDPGKMNRSEWQTYVTGISGLLSSAGYVVSEVDMQRIARRTAYCEAVYGQTLAQAVQFLKAEFGRVLLEEETFEAGDYQIRLEVFMGMLGSRGQEVSQSAQRLFSEPVTGTMPSPERAGAGLPRGVGSDATFGAAPKARAVVPPRFPGIP